MGIFKKIEEYCPIWKKFAPAVKLLSGVQEVNASNGYWDTGYLKKCFRRFSHFLGTNSDKLVLPSIRL